MRQPELPIGLKTATAGTVKISAAARDKGRRDAERYVRNRSPDRDAISSSAYVDPARRIGKCNGGFYTVSPLRTEAFIRQCNDVAQAKTSIELV
jgi:hypothetical protein